MTDRRNMINSHQGSLLGHLFTKTNNGTEVRGTETIHFEHHDVARWGVFVSYGDRNTFLAVELQDGTRATVLQGLQEAEESKWVKRKKRTIKIDGIEAAGIRTARTCGICWEIER